MAFQTIPGSAEGISIPVMIVNKLDILKSPESLQKFDSFEYLLQVQKNLLEEDQKKLNQCLTCPNHLSQIFNSSLFNISVSRILQKTLKPMSFFLHRQIVNDQKILESLKHENNQLQELLNNKT